MARDILILSPSYQEATLPAIRTRNRLLAECLTDDYFFPEDNVQTTITRMREKGYDKPLTKYMASEGRMNYRNIYRYYNNESFREHVDTFLRGLNKGGAHARCLGIACLQKDRPDLKTWEDVERALDAAAAGEETQTEAAPEPETRAEFAATPDMLTGADSPLEAVLTQIMETGELMRRIASCLSTYIPQQQRQAEHDQKQIADLQRENAHLRRRMEEWLRQGQAAARGIMEVKELGAEVAHRLLLAAYNLPEKTSTSLTGWHKELDPLRNNNLEKKQSSEFWNDQLIARW